MTGGQFKKRGLYNMSDFILEYNILESIATNSKSLGKRSKEYSEKLESKIISGIDCVAGPSSGYLMSASDSVRDKINALKLKSDAFYHFADQISNLLEVAEQIDQEVADAIAAQREFFLDHHESLRIADWKAALLGLIVDIKNSIPLLGTIADVLEGLNAVFESLEDSIKHWYECEGGKYVVQAIGSVVAAAVAVTLFVVAFPVSGFFAVCGAIGAGIAAVNAITNVATSFRAADAAIDGNPAWAVIYGKQDKLSDVLRQTNFGSGVFNDLSNFSGGALDATETFCDVVGFAELGKNAIKLFKGDAFKLLKNKGSMNFSDLKNGSKSDIVDLKNNILEGYADSKNGIKEAANPKSLLGDMSVDDLSRYNKHWDDVATGAHDIPYGMNADEYCQYLKGLDKVDDAIKSGLKTKLDYVTSNGLKLEATPGRTTTVLGTYKSDTGAILDELGNVKSLDFGPRDGGFNLLNTPDELYVSPEQFWTEYNKPWLDNVIARDDLVKIATEPAWDNLTRINRVTGKTELTGFGREYTYLKKHGYKYDTISKIMGR
jgi:hypothetical protein